MGLLPHSKCAYIYLGLLKKQPFPVQSVALATYVIIVCMTHGAISFGAECARGRKVFVVLAWLKL